MAVHGAMISSLPRGCHRAGTCPGSGGRPFPVGRRRLREHVAHEMHHAPLVLRLGQHRADRGDEPGASVADHEPDALQAAFDHRGLEQGALEFRHLQLEPDRQGRQARAEGAETEGRGLRVGGDRTIPAARAERREIIDRHVPGRRGQLRDPQRHLHLEPRVQQMGRRVRRRGHGRRGHRPHRPPRQDPPLPRRILPEQTLPHEINQTNNKTRNQPPTVFKLNADGVQIKCRTRPPQFDEIHLQQFAYRKSISVRCTALSPERKSC